MYKESNSDAQADAMSRLGYTYVSIGSTSTEKLLTYNYDQVHLNYWYDVCEGMTKK